MSSSRILTCLLFIIFAFSTLPFQASGRETAKSGKALLPQAKKDPRGPQSAATNAACRQPFKDIPEIFIREFDLKPKDAAQVQVQFLGGSGPRFFSATHPDFCSLGGCESGLFVVSNNCSKLVLNYAGTLRPLGNAKAPFQKIRVEFRQSAVDGGGIVKKKYEFQSELLEYREVED